MFGNGKTAVKYSTGKYLEGSQVGGIYTASNPATGGRTINSYSESGATSTAIASSTAT